MQFLRAVSHSIVHAQPLQIQDHSSDESDPADKDVADDAQATHSHADGVESVPDFVFIVTNNTFYTVLPFNRYDTI